MSDLSDEEKQIIEKAVQLIIRDYGEVLKKLAEEQMKIDFNQKELEYLKDVLLFQRLLDHKRRDLTQNLVVRINEGIEKYNKIIAEDTEDKRYRKKISK